MHSLADICVSAATSLSVGIFKHKETNPSSSCPFWFEFSGSCAWDGVKRFGVFEGIFSVDGIGGGEGERMVREEGGARVATKWVGLAAAIWVQASAGNAYMFAFYSPTLKAVLHCNQLQLNNLGVAKDFGENVGLIAGLLCNKLPAWTLLCTGALLGCLGYGTLYLVVSEQIAPLPYWQVRAHAPPNSQNQHVGFCGVLGFLRICMDMHQQGFRGFLWVLGFLRISMDMHQQGSVGFCGFLWSFVGFGISQNQHGYRSTGFLWVLWSFVGFCGFLWSFVGFVGFVISQNQHGYGSTGYCGFCGFCGFCDFSESAWVWINWVFVGFVGFGISQNQHGYGLTGFLWVFVGFCGVLWVLWVL
jgi:hypothetical protein